MNEYIVSILTVQFKKGVNEHEQTHNCFKPNATHVRTPAHTTRPSGTREPHAETDHIRTQKNVDENELANILVTFNPKMVFFLVALHLLGCASGTKLTNMRVDEGNMGFFCTLQCVQLFNSILHECKCFSF